MSANLEPGAAADSAGVEEIAEPVIPEHSPSTDLDRAVETQEPLAPMSAELPAETLAETPANVLPFRPIGETKPPSLTPVENSAFNELARQLSARLDDNGEANAPAETAPAEIVTEPEVAAVPAPASDGPDWLAPPEPPARGQAKRDRMLLDLLPAGVLIYRLDRLLYANPAFLKRIGYDSLHALEEAGGVDALYVEPGVPALSSTSQAGTPVMISAGHAGQQGAEPIPTAARLHTIAWDDEAALALICSEGPVDAAPVPAPIAAPEALPTVGEADAEELGAILDTTAEGIVMFDEQGNVNACNRSAEALFGYDGDELVRRNLADLFAPESRGAVQDYLESVRQAGAGDKRAASASDHRSERQT